MTPERGGITGNFDMLHVDHLTTLEIAKFHCKYLIVGLKTDEAAAKTKRLPILSYEHRKALLLATKFVDEVVPHTTEPKSDFVSENNLDIVFTSTEYKFSVEFESLHRDSPGTDVMYIDRGEITSTSELVERLEERFSPRFFAMGIGGPLLKSHDDKCVYKCINLTREEAMLFSEAKDNDDILQLVKHNMGKFTADVLRFTHQEKLPRNSRADIQKNNCTFPNISGVNGVRELAALILLQNAGSEIGNVLQRVELQWLTTKTPPPPSQELVLLDVEEDEDEKECEVGHRKSEVLHTYDGKRDSDQGIQDLHKFASEVAKKRSDPDAILLLKLKHGGTTLKEFIEAHGFMAERTQEIIWKTKDYIQEMHAIGVVHGDVHLRNVLVDETDDDRVTIIDYGWTTHQCFGLSSETEHGGFSEVELHQKQIQNNFDLTYFENSLELYASK